MTWHYAAGGEKHGPVDDAELDRLIAAGVVTGETLVWRQGQDTWRPLREVRVGALVAAAAARPEAPAAPAAPRPRPDAEAEFARVGGRRIAPISAISRGVSLVFAQPGPAIGISALIMLMIFAAGFVPCIGSLVQIAVTGPLTAAWYLHFLRMIRGRPGTMEDVFAVFSSPDLVQMILAHVIVAVIGVLVMVPMVFVVIFSMFGSLAAFAAAASASGPDAQAAPLLMFPIMAIVSLPFLAVYVYVSLAFIFSLPLILDRGHAFWPAMRLSQRVVHRNLLPMIGLGLLCWLMLVAGILALCLGIFVAAPIAVASMAHAYEDVFGEAPV